MTTQPGPPGCPSPNENQLTLTKSPPPLRRSANTVWAPVGWLDTLVLSVVQACQPPVPLTVNWVSSGPVADPVRSSIEPPPGTDATRAWITRAPAGPRSTLSYRIQSPLAR